LERCGFVAEELGLVFGFLQLLGRRRGVRVLYGVVDGLFARGASFDLFGFVEFDEDLLRGTWNVL
jgi:hypothetical protein